MAYPQQAPAFGPPAAQAPTAGPMPPNMHWAVVLILTWITVGLAGLIWCFKEASFVKKIDPASKARTLLVATLLGMVAQVALYFVALSSGSATTLAAIGMVVMVLNLVMMVLGLVAIFGMRASMVRYYNTVEPMGLRLSGVMTFFFNILYFQYHFSRIAGWKKTGILR